MSAGFEIQNRVLIGYTGSETEIIIPDGVVEIGKNVFKENKKITEVTMPDSVIKIGDSAFEKCTKLKVVVFSNRLEEIAYKAFSGCKALKEVELPDTLKELGSGCFTSCDKLTKMVCTSKVFRMSGNPFQLYDEKIPEGIADKDGFIIFADILYCYIGSAKTINVPEGVTHIAHGLFRSGTYHWEKKYDIESVILPSTIRYIGNHAFRNCKKLKSVSMPKGIEVGEHVFDGCDELVDEDGFFVKDGVAYAYCGDNATVTVPEGTKVLVPQLFANVYESNAGNANIHEIVLPEGLEVIGERAFEGCGLLERISVPNSVHTIGSAAFKDCTHLSKIELPNTVQNIGDGILVGCKGLADGNGYVIANNTVQAFYGGDKNIKIPEGIIAIANGVFDKSGITSITLPATLKLLGSAFVQCDMLEEIVIPEGVKEISKRAFYGCENLKSITLPSSLEVIGALAFCDCKSLTEVNLPERLCSIEEEAFRGCTSLTKMSIPKNIKSLESSVLKGCSQIAQITLPEGLEIIGKFALAHCNSLKEISIPGTVKRVEQNAFSGCSLLKNIELVADHIEIDKLAFTDCPELADKDGFTIINSILYKYSKDGGTVVVPEGVTAIVDNVFREGYSRERRSGITYRDSGSLKEIVLPGSLKTIGNNVFDGCTELKKVILPNSIKSLGVEAFYECTKLQDINLLEGLESIGGSAFYGCEALQSIGIPATVKTIGEDAFKNCKSLKEIIVDEGSEVYSSIDGILMNKSGDTILFVPGGKKITEYIVPETVKTIGRQAFIDCESLKKIVIYASVENVGDEAFPRSGWYSKAALSDIEVDPEAGSGTIGEDVFDIFDGDKPIVYPKLPITFVKDSKTQVSLALGFCLNPEKYEGKYAELYKKYVISHEKTLTKKAASLKLKGIEEYFSEAKSSRSSKVKGKSNGDTVENVVNSEYKPDLSTKKPSELVKVEILEEVVQKGTLQDVIDVLNTYKTFEMTARALGLAARYRGVEFVEVLVNHGASFNYKSEATLQRKYKMDQSTVCGSYSTKYYLMIVPEKLELSVSEEGKMAYTYLTMYGVTNMNISSDIVPLSLEKRMEVVKYLANNKKAGISLDDMLFWALITDELEFADALMEIGVNLQETPPAYFASWGEVPTYLDMVTSAGQSVYWNFYVSSITSLKVTSVFPVLERFCKLVAAAGKQLIVSQKMFDEVKWSDESLAYVLKNANLSKINQKKALEKAVSTTSLSALEIMAEAGWLSNAKKREGLIDFARTNKHKDALAWLMDFKNRTVDVAKEEAKEEAKMFKELMEDPNSVSALKKKWSYVKLEDGTLQITSYKGNEEEVEIPATIGKALVTSVGKEAFSIWKQSIKNEESRKKIKSVLIPDAVTEIGDEAFRGCESIETVKIPASLKKIGEFAFGKCSKLKEVVLPSGVSVGKDAFSGCIGLASKEGFIMIGDTLYDYYGLNEDNPILVVPEGITKIAPYAFTSKWSGNRPSHIREVVLPEGLVEIGEFAFSKVRFDKVVFPGTVKKIGEKAFYGCCLTSLELPEGLSSLGVSAFEYNMFTELKIPKSLTSLPSKAFYSCSELREVYIPDTVKKIGDAVFGEKKGWAKVEGVYVHTPSGSAAEEYMKEFGGIYVVNDYAE